MKRFEGKLAGVNRFTKFADLQEQDWDSPWGVDLKGATLRSHRR